jgi:hypothetical protein
MDGSDRAQRVLVGERLVDAAQVVPRLEGRNHDREQRAGELVEDVAAGLGRAERRQRDRAHAPRDGLGVPHVRVDLDVALAPDLLLLVTLSLDLLRGFGAGQVALLLVGRALVDQLAPICSPCLELAGLERSCCLLAHLRSPALRSHHLLAHLRRPALRDPHLRSPALHSPSLHTPALRNPRLALELGGHLRSPALPLVIRDFAGAVVGDRVIVPEERRRDGGVGDSVGLGLVVEDLLCLALGGAPVVAPVARVRLAAAFPTGLLDPHEGLVHLAGRACVGLLGRRGLGRHGRKRGLSALQKRTFRSQTCGKHPITHFRVVKIQSGSFRGISTCSKNISGKLKPICRDLRVVKWISKSGGLVSM